MQTYEKLKKVYKEIDQLDKERKEYLVEMFQMAPDFVFENIKLHKYQKDVIFIREHTPVNCIYILLDGLVSAVENRILGIQYDFLRFRGVQLFGGMEILLDMDVYGTSLVTVSCCTFLILEKTVYNRWLQQTPKVLQSQAKDILKQLFEQGRKERLLSFLQGRERLFLIFTEEFEMCHRKKNICKIPWTQGKLAACAGLSVRTVNRAMQKMSEDGYISYSRGKILINEQQYLKMKEYLNQIIAK